MAAVFFLGESFSFINGVGLVVLICGVALFNWFKYQKIVSGQAKGGKPAPDKMHSSATKDVPGDEETAWLVGGARFSGGAFQCHEVFCAMSTTPVDLMLQTVCWPEYLNAQAVSCSL